MRRIIIIFSIFAVLLTLGISIGAPKLVHLQQDYIGEDNPKNQKWLTTNDKEAIAANILCEENENPPDRRIPKYRICTVKYFTSFEDRKSYELKYKGQDRKFYLADENTPYDSKSAIDSALANKKYATYGALEVTRQRYGSYPAIWAMGPDGRLYVSSTQQPGMFHHSSFLGGGSIICGGEIIIIEGRIKYINNRSGHYRPPDKALWNAVDELLKQGVKLDDDLQIGEYNSGKCTRLKDRGKEDPSDASINNGIPYDTYIKKSNIDPCD